MILDGSRGWYWQLKSLPERVKEQAVRVRFSIIEREIGDRLFDNLMTMDLADIVAWDIGDADTLLGILFDESLKSKCIAAIDENWNPMSVIDVTIVLVQGGKGYTNIDADVLESFAKVLET